MTEADKNEGPTTAAEPPDLVAELRDRLEKVDLKGVCLDTNLFISACGRSFTHDKMRILLEKCTGGIHWVLPSIIAGEMLAKSFDRLNAASLDAKSAVGRLEKCASIPKSILATVTSNLIDPRLQADREFNEFKSRTEVLPLQSGEYVDIETLERMYFSQEPPFDVGEKKAEFPDAMALLSLLGWATERQGTVLCISDDAGWADFCETTNGSLIHCKNLTTALGALTAVQEIKKAQLQKEILADSEAEILTAHLSETLSVTVKQLLVTDGEFRRQFTKQLQSRVENAELNLSYSSPDYSDLEADYVEFDDFDLVDEPGGFVLIGIEEDEAYFSLKVLIDITAYGTATFYVRDTEDERFTKISSQDVVQQANYEAEITMTVHVIPIGEPVNNFEVTFYEIDSDDLHGIEVDAGTLEMDASDDYYGR